MSVISNKDLQSRPIRDLSEAIAQIPGVSVDVGATSFGGFAVSLRGMPASYTLFLVDGVRQDSDQETFPNVNFSQGSFMPPIAAIERIEVIRGPASTIYGSDAIGGVVNVILKKSFDKWVSNATLEATAQERQIFSNYLGVSLFTAGPLDSLKKWSLQLRVKDTFSFSPLERLSNLNYNPSDANSTPTLGPNEISLIGAGKSNQYQIGTRLGYAMNEHNYFYTDFAHFGQWYDPHAFENTLFMRNNFLLRHQGSYGTNGIIRTDSSVQYNSNYNETRNRLGQDIVAEHKTIVPFWRMKVIAGGQYVYNTITALNGTKFGGDVPTLLDRHNFSIFAEDEYMILDNVILTFGGRLNVNSSFGFNFSPRAFFIYHIMEDSIWGFTLNLGVSTGYKVPTITQVAPG